MRDFDETTTEPAGAEGASLFERAINQLSLGIIIFDSKREVVFCNARYREIYGLSPERVQPGTPISALIQHRLNLGLKVRATAEDYIRERVGREMVEDSAVHEFMDGRVIRFRIYPLPDGSGMATHEDITEREEILARLERQYEFGKAQEEKLQLRNLQFDTAINNMSQGLCFFDASHRLIVCNDLYIDMYDLP